MSRKVAVLIQLVGVILCRRKTIQFRKAPYVFSVAEYFTRGPAIATDVRLRMHGSATALFGLFEEIIRLNRTRRRHPGLFDLSFALGRRVVLGGLLVEPQSGLEVAMLCRSVPLLGCFAGA